MSQNHTAGPWSVAKGCDQYVGSDGKWIASTMGIRGVEGAANARLIAAAPELLEALSRLVGEELGGDSFTGVRKDHETYRSVISWQDRAFARAAISKAKASSS